MQFSFKAINKEGRSYTGVLEASDKYALAKELQTKGDTLISAAEKGAKVNKTKQFKETIDGFLGTIKIREKIVFSRNLSAMIDAGLTISRSLEVMGRQTRNKKFKKVLDSVSDNIRQGRSLSDSVSDFPKVFPPLFVSMTKAGEESGKLSESLSTVGRQMEHAYQLSKRIRGALMYPSIIVIVMVIVGILMMIFVVPSLTDTFVELNVELPKSTQSIILVSNFLKNNTIISLVGIALSILGLIAIGRNKKGKRFYEYLALHSPIIGLVVKETNSARTARTLSSLLNSGVEVVEALGITREVIQNSYYKDILAEAEASIQKGKTVAETFLKYEELYPPLVGEMLSVGEEVGSMPEMLERVALFYEGEVEQKTKDMSTIIEPFLMIVVGTAVGFFAISMISPIYSLSSGI